MSECRLCQSGEEDTLKPYGIPVEAHPKKRVYWSISKHGVLRARVVNEVLGIEHTADMLARFCPLCGRNLHEKEAGGLVVEDHE